MTHVLCITGMHRSGTSLAASWLEQCGLQIHDGELIGSGTGNPHGHFEDKQFNKLHTRAIQTLDSNSMGWQVVNDLPRAIPDEQLDDLRALVDERNEKYELWGWKDPRTVVFLDHWKKLIPDMTVMLLWRRCADVVDSLLRRARDNPKKINRISPAKAIRVWSAYNRRAIKYKQQHPDDTILIPVTAMIEHDEAVYSWLAERIDVSMRYTPIKELLDSSLLRESDASPWQRLLSNLFHVPRMETAMAEASDQPSQWKSSST